MTFHPVKPARRPRIGLYSIGLAQYWNQFEGLYERLVDYGRFIESRLTPLGEVHNVGMVDSDARARDAVAEFQAKNVDLILCHVATYATSATHLAIAKGANCPIVVLNLQPTAAMNYEKTTTGEWLAHCVGCPVPEIANAFQRSGVEFHLVTGLLGLDKTPAISLADEATAAHPEAIAAWNEITEWVRAAGVARTLRDGRMGFLGNTYPGMLDMYSDFTMIESQTGMHVEILEMCDFAKIWETVSDREIAAKLKQVHEMFIVSEDSPADPLARKPKPEQLDAACRVAVALERLVREFDLDALTYYYRGRAGHLYEQLQESFILGHSLLTAQGIPCSGEGDMKTAVAMKVCDVLGVGGSYSEIVAADYDRGTILLGHDGPFHIAIAASKPILRGMGLYHGKWGTGVSVEATVRKGPVTTLNITQTMDGKLRAIVNQGEAIEAPILKIGNTMTHVRFPLAPTPFMNAWFAMAPTHHCAMSVGHNAPLLRKVAAIMQWPCTSVATP